MAEVPVPTVAPTTAPITNKSTGIEVKATDFWIEKQQKFGGLMGKTHVFYQLLCATNNAKSLGCKNAEASRRNDVSDGVDVHFTIGKSYEEIAQFRNDLDLHFSGSFFPPLPKTAVSGSSELEHRKQARSCQDTINKLFNICCEQKKIAFGKVFLNFFGFRTNAKTIENLIADKKEAAAEAQLEGDDDIFESRAREEKEIKKQREDLFSSETTMSKDESLFDNDDEVEVTSQSTSNKQVGMFNNDQLFPTEDEQKVATISEDDDDDDEIDLSDLMSQLKAVPKIEKTKKTTAPANSNKVEQAETSDEAGEDVDEENLLEYINQNLNLDDVSLDFD